MRQVRRAYIMYAQRTGGTDGSATAPERVRPVRHGCHRRDLHQRRRRPARRHRQRVHRGLARAGAGPGHARAQLEGVPVPRKEVLRDQRAGRRSARRGLALRRPARRGRAAVGQRPHRSAARGGGHDDLVPPMANLRRRRPRDRHRRGRAGRDHRPRSAAVPRRPVPPPVPARDRNRLDGIPGLPGPRVVRRHRRVRPAPGPRRRASLTPDPAARPDQGRNDMTATQDRPASTEAATHEAPTTRPMTGDEYVESLKDDREIWIYGERVKDVTEHPAFRNPVRMTARLYDALHDPARQDKLLVPTDTGSGGRTHPFFRTPHSSADLLADKQAIETWARMTWGWMGRSPDYKASFFFNQAGNT